MTISRYKEKACRLLALSDLDTDVLLVAVRKDGVVQVWSDCSSSLASLGFITCLEHTLSVQVPSERIALDPSE
jgi:hypothetical protein